MSRVVYQDHWESSVKEEDKFYVNVTFHVYFCRCKWQYHGEHCQTGYTDVCSEKCGGEDRVVRCTTDVHRRGYYCHCSASYTGVLGLQYEECDHFILYYKYTYYV